MKRFKLPVLLMACLMFTNVCFAEDAPSFLNTLKTLSKTAIKQLSSEALADAYIDVIVEIEANKSFHNASGYTPKEYESFKKLLKYRIYLIQEFRTRELDVPRFDG